MKCPKCGYVRQTRDNVFAPPTECPACGVVYAKYLTSDASSTSNPLEIGGGPKRPSPVHEASLKQARDRVERRLRKKFNPNEKDEFREITLQRARQFVSEGVKKRREEMQHRKEEALEEAQMAAADNVDQPLQDVEPGIDPLTEPSPPESAQMVSRDETEMRHADEPAEQPTSEITNPATDEDSQVQESTPQPVAAEADTATETEALEAETTETETTETEMTETEMTETEMTETEMTETEMTETEMTETEMTEAEATEAYESEAEASAEAPEDVYSQVFTMDAEEEEQPEGEARSFEASDSGDEPPGQWAAAAALEAMPLSNDRFKSGSTGSGLMRLLPAVAWMILVAGVVGAVLSWTTLNDVQAGVSTAAPYGSNRLPVALLLGFAYLATGVLGFAFFWVSSMINTQIKEIRQLLQPLSRDSE